MSQTGTKAHNIDAAESFECPSRNACASSANHNSLLDWSVRPDGVVDFVNQRSLDYAGLSLEEYLKGPTGAIHPEDFPRVMEKWLADMARWETLRG